MDIRKELEECFRDPLLAWINEESAKKMSEVVRDVFPGASKEEILARLDLFWEEKDTPETLYDKLINLKNK